ncbi:glycosyltransferase [Rubrolithibacter danxiaensis]|uniref:glycosyltransferase n=1 Tax=Rubrolithibacter danxiaensis TaxID=3390805 RepID=UPI003BF87327
MNFVFVGLQRINTNRESTSTGLAKALAQNHNVLYVNPPIDRKTYFSENKDEFTSAHILSIKHKEEKLTKLDSNLWMLNPHKIMESINWIPSTTIFSVFNRYNNTLFAKEIREALSELGFDKFILINDKDIFRSFYLKEFLKPELYVYLDRDYTLGVDYWRKHGLNHEPKLMQKADTVVCNSYDYTNRAKNFNKNSFYIGNGFDDELYNDDIEWALPDDLKNISKPIIGYVGALTSLRLDLDLMLKVAIANPQWNIVLIGPEDDNFKSSNLHTLSNIYYLGKKDKNIVPSYIKHFDVCINPQAINEITVGNFPLKINEYLALGRPIVATSTNPMKEIFGNIVYLATNAEQYISQIKRALTEDDKDRQHLRKEFVKNFSWKRIAQILLECLKSTTKTTT